jgi:CBS domain-containing protein
LGHGAPPVPYAYLLFGSGGRSEQTMSSDQDSGLVYANPADEEQAERFQQYYHQFASIIVQSLITISYPPCEGNVIASNTDWCLALSEWESKIDRWFTDPSWENVRYLLIAADCRLIAGDSKLAEKIKDRFFNDLLVNPIIAERMLQNTLRHKVLLGVFGQLLREQYGDDAGSLDVKYGAYIPMVNAFRLMSLRSGIRETNTLRRITALQYAGVLTIREAEDASQAFSFFLKLRLLATIKNEDGQLASSGKISQATLTKELMKQLKHALRMGKYYQRKVERDMRGRFGGR